MITSTAVVVPESKVYPCLMALKNNLKIVLFTEEKVGSVVNGINLGDHSKNWDMAQFIPYSGKVILENS